MAINYQEDGDSPQLGRHTNIRGQKTDRFPFSGASPHKGYLVVEYGGGWRITQASYEDAKKDPDFKIGTWTPKLPDDIQSIVDQNSRTGDWDYYVTPDKRSVTLAPRSKTENGSVPYVTGSGLIGFNNPNTNPYAYRYNDGYLNRLKHKLWFDQLMYGNGEKKSASDITRDLIERERNNSVLLDSAMQYNDSIPGKVDKYIYLMNRPDGREGFKHHIVEFNPDLSKMVDYPVTFMTGADGKTDSTSVKFPEEYWGLVNTNHFTNHALGGGANGIGGINAQVMGEEPKTPNYIGPYEKAPIFKFSNGAYDPQVTAAKEKGNYTWKNGVKALNFITGGTMTPIMNGDKQLGYVNSNGKLQFYNPRTRLLKDGLLNPNGEGLMEGSLETDPMGNRILKNTEGEVIGWIAPDGTEYTLRNGYFVSNKDLEEENMSGADTSSQNSEPEGIPVQPTLTLPSDDNPAPIDEYESTSQHSDDSSRTYDLSSVIIPNDSSFKQQALKIPSGSANTRARGGQMKTRIPKHLRDSYGRKLVRVPGWGDDDTDVYSFKTTSYKPHLQIAV